MNHTMFELNGRIGHENGLTCRQLAEDSHPLQIKITGNAEGYPLHLATNFVNKALKLEPSETTLLLEHAVVTERSVPVLYCYPKSDTPLPTVLFIHGMTGDKVMDLDKGIQLAQNGFFVVLIDVRWHGERKHPQFHSYFYDNDKQTNCRRFFETIHETVEDVIALLDHVQKDSRVDPNRLGMSGISMGGYISFATAARDRRIKAIAPMIASPDWNVNTESLDPNEYVPELQSLVNFHNPMNHYQRLYSIPLLVQNGVIDRVINISGVRKLHQLVTQECGELPKGYIYIEYPEVGHTATSEMLNQMVTFFRSYL
ncbi:alpha/beta hydrolase family protein [Paenibacillus roseipurpureus]|uniref:Alpha/beta fold hydrolase n=1 Tax=Paenibacillus roseopurpureus TaxID=2918901 RepID=A0AA96LRR3_9BACL|nr:alpha/beta fold hydrolase [Paenibacillus sp. MBLB1832]WNR46019.1 alpha/beta fold hydrolase [Paenibacillus sp. MBLB1832]